MRLVKSEHETLTIEASSAEIERLYELAEMALHHGDYLPWSADRFKYEQVHQDLDDIREAVKKIAKVQNE